MKRMILTKQKENSILQFVIVAFWAVFWLFNVIDKIIPGSTFLWVGKDRFAQISEYFMTIGVENPMVTTISLGAVTIVEAVALAFFALSLVYFIAGNKKYAHSMFFWGAITSLVIFSGFSIADQVFGDRFELLEHSIYWVTIIASWFAYKASEK